MQIRRFQDLVVWQLSRELEKRVFAFTDKCPAKRDGDYCQQIRKSASSAPRNIAEGFGRFWPTEFAHKLRIARGELAETQDHLAKGLEQKYVSDTEAAEMIHLSHRAIGAVTRFLQYLGRAGESWKKGFRAAQQKRRSENPEP